MRAVGVILGSVLFVALSCNGDADVDKGFQLKQDKTLSRIRPEKPVNIKLKRNFTGGYSWEIKGDNVEKIIEADKRLRKTIRNTEKGEKE